jgi:RNA polymerase sigma-70 factor (ECF subfamily)
MPDSDLELLEAWRGGDAKAGNALFDRYFDAVFRFFRNKVADHADDLVQQTFLALVQARDRFRGDSSVRTYLFTAARSKLFNYLERRAREGAVDYGVTSCEDLGISPTGVLARDQQQQHLLHALRRLPIELQLALELFYFERVRGPELAEVLGVPEGTVRSRLRRGRDHDEQPRRLGRTRAPAARAAPGRRRALIICAVARPRPPRGPPRAIGTTAGLRPTAVECFGAARYDRCFVPCESWSSKTIPCSAR